MHVATIYWENQGPDFVAGRYSRAHTWTFDNGATLPASPSPQVVPAPWSNPAGIDPEEAFLASLASCHMLTFLWLASKAGWTVERYLDNCVAVLTKNERRVPWVSQATLRPQIEWGGKTRPSAAEVADLHARAHEQCFIANSVRTEVVIEAQQPPP